MKKLLRFTIAISATAMMGWLAGCSTTGTTSSASASSQKETLLRQAGFISKTVTTPKQEQQVAQLSPGVVSAVKYKGKLLYAYPTGTRDQVLVGRQAEYDAYKKALQAQAAQAQQSQTQQDSHGAYLTGETVGPHRITVEEFDGFGPMDFGPEGH